MIYWLRQSSDSHPLLARGLAPEGLLTEEETARFANLKSAKRRHDWLLGRWTAKRLLQHMMIDAEGEKPAYDAFSIVNRENGAPAVICHKPTAIDGLTLSISHAGTQSLCAVVAQSDCPLGADIERVAARSQTFVADFFTPDEIGLVSQATPVERGPVITAIWSGKEAALKALQLGLTVDARAVTCHIGPTVPSSHTWHPFRLSLDPTRLGVEPQLEGYWQCIPGYVLTLVAAPGLAPARKPVF